MAASTGGAHAVTGVWTSGQSVPARMRAVTQRRYGSAEVLEVGDLTAGRTRGKSVLLVRPTG